MAAKHAEFVLFTVYILIWMSLCDAQCQQLGCDAAGRFTQDTFQFRMLDGNRAIAWKSQVFSTASLSPQNVNFGCVTDDKIVACIRDMNGEARHFYLNATDGSEIDVSCEGVVNSGAAVITKLGEVLAVNKTHIGVVNPIANQCHVQKHGHMLIKNSLSPVHMEKSDVYVIAGNSTDLIMIWRIDESGLLVKVTDYNLPTKKSQTNCPWKQITEVAISGNRIYIFAAAKVQNTGMDSIVYGILALDLIDTDPWIKSAWILLDQSETSESLTKADDSLTAIDQDNCEVFDDGSLESFPPMDLAAQMLATPDKFLVLNYILSLQIVQDHGKKAERIMSNLWGDHFLTFVGSSARGNSTVWMSGWSSWPSFSNLLTSLSYAPPYDPNVKVKGLSFLNYLNASSMNVTSRMTSFAHPAGGDKIIVFSAEHGNTDIDNKRSIIATRSPFIVSNDARPIWRFPLPDDLDASRVKGQIIGAGSNLVCYVTNDKAGYILAIK